VSALVARKDTILVVIRAATASLTEEIMKKLTYTLAACSLALGCSSGTSRDEDTASSQQALDVLQGASLTKRNIAGNVETDRQLDTLNGYYATVGTAKNGTGPNINVALSKLSDFRTRYAFGSTTPTAETITYYYNRGDLGIGREMHCQDRLAQNGEIACYVTNFYAGAANTEFAFGLSKDIAFANMDAHQGFATVAMVYREVAALQNRIFFVVYDAAGNKATAAALDRVGHLFNTGQNTTSTPGTNFNNHIPSNCLNCHGGTYNATSHTVFGAFFLPFDLDQFQYQTTAGRTRPAQLEAFKTLNTMVWKVAVLSANAAGPLSRQINTWYSNTSLQNDPHQEVLEGSFQQNTPAGWSGAAATNVYQSVIRHTPSKPCGSSGNRTAELRWQITSTPCRA
jgi:hypothetical protein